MENKINILALDPATKTGFACKNASGVWDLKTKSYESKGMRLIKLRSSLDEICKAENINFVVYEKPGGRNYNALKSHSNFEGIIQAYCLDNGIEYKGYSAGEIKRFATGKGNANKQAMIDAFKDKKGYDPIDDNEADAFHLYGLAAKEFGNE